MDIETMSHMATTMLTADQTLRGTFLFAPTAITQPQLNRVLSKKLPAGGERRRVYARRITSMRGSGSISEAACPGTNGTRMLGRGGLSLISPSTDTANARTTTTRLTFIWTVRLLDIRLTYVEPSVERRSNVSGDSLNLCFR
jgi:hypothetical protein